VPALQFSHGLNLATVNGYRCRRAAPREEQTTGVALYLGIGAGVVVPHVEARIGDVRTYEYQLVGEAILSWADARADLADGGEVRTRLLVPQLSLGLSLRD